VPPKKKLDKRYSVILNYIAEGVERACLSVKLTIRSLLSRTRTLHERKK
jgi:hypothetical protein